MTQKEVRCNICESPREIEYQEIDHETGKVKRVKTVVGCLGHEGVHPSFWNKSVGNSSGGMRGLGYDDYHKNDKPRKLIRIELPPKKVKEKKHVSYKERAPYFREREETQRKKRPGKNRTSQRR